MDNRCIIPRDSSMRIERLCPFRQVYQIKQSQGALTNRRLWMHVGIQCTR